MTAIRHCLLSDRGCLRITGEDAVGFLQGLISNDVTKAAPGQAVYATLLSAQGRFLFDFIIAARDGALLLDCEAERAADLARRLGMYKLRSKVTIENLSETNAVAVVWGDGAAAAVGLPAPGAAALQGEVVALADPRLPALGIRLLGPRAAVEAAVRGKGEPAAPADWHRHRLSLGVPDGSRDLPVDKALLLEHNFEELNAIDFGKGCYIGQELTARTKYRGLVRKRLFKVAVEGELPPKGTPIMRGTHEAGTLYGGAAGEALALLRLEDVDSGEPLTAEGRAVRPSKPPYAAF